MKRVLVTGDRRWIDQGYIDRIMDSVVREHGRITIIEGCAEGVDEMVGDHSWETPGPIVRKRSGWAHWRGVPTEHFPADWASDRSGAGAKRNLRMLAARPDLVIAFHGDLMASRGTRMMVELARRDGLEVRLYTGRGDEPIILRPVDAEERQYLPLRSSWDLRHR
jgi:hypothetical protein